MKNLSPKVELKDSKPAEKSQSPPSRKSPKPTPRWLTKSRRQTRRQAQVGLLSGDGLDSAAASKLKAALNKAGLAAKMHETVQEAGRTGGKFWYICRLTPTATRR